MSLRSAAGTVEAMAQQLTEPFRRRHESLRPRVARIADVAREIPSLDPRQRRAVVAESLGFLRGDLQLHAEAEEGWLYPEIALQLRHPLATAGMAFDHELRREQMNVLEAVDVHDTPALQAVLYKLHALLDTHFRKEEEVYLPLLEYEGEAAAIVAIEEAMTRHERGEAQGQVLLRAAQDEVSASFFNQPIEVEELRAAVGRLAGGGVPQIVLRLGYGPAVRPTPRRPLSDVVMLDGREQI